MTAFWPADWLRLEECLGVWPDPSFLATDWFGLALGRWVGGGEGINRYLGLESGEGGAGVGEGIRDEGGHLGSELNAFLLR